MRALALLETAGAGARADGALHAPSILHVSSVRDWQSLGNGRFISISPHCIWLINLLGNIRATITLISALSAASAQVVRSMQLGGLAATHSGPLARQISARLCAQTSASSARTSLLVEMPSEEILRLRLG